MITLAIPLKNCDQCSYYRGNHCYGFGTAKKVFSKSEAILCDKYTPLGKVQIGPLDSLAGQLTAFQIPDGIISSLKLADLAVTVAKLGISSVNDSKVAAGAGIVENKLSLDYGTDALNDLIDANDIDIASNLALILLREEFANKGAASGYCGLDASQFVPLANLSNLTNDQLAAAAAIIESKLNLDHSTQSLFDKVGTDIGTHAEIATAHQDAPALIATHAGLPSVHHTQSHTLASHSDVAASGAQLEALLMFGSANAAWVPCIFEGSSIVDYDMWDESGCLMGAGGLDDWVTWRFTFPCNRGSLKLHICGIRWYQYNADASDFVSYYLIRGLDSAGGMNTIASSPTNETTVGEKPSAGITFAAVDASANITIIVLMQRINAIAGELKISNLALKCYYAV